MAGKTIKRWTKVADNQVIHIWKCKEGKCEDSSVYPPYYQDNGTPVCECDRDMVYSHTEVRK